MPSNPAALGWALRWLAAAGGWVRALLRACVMLAAFVLMLGTLFVGLLLVAALVVWGLLRGRRPAAGVFNAAFDRGRRHHHSGPGQVIDVEVREVADPVLPSRGP